MSELDLGNVPLVKIRNCPIPKDPLSSIFNAIGLNMTHIETLQYQYVPTDNTESLAGTKRLMGRESLIMSNEKFNLILGYHFENLTKLKELTLDT